MDYFSCCINSTAICSVSISKTYNNTICVNYATFGIIYMIFLCLICLPFTILIHLKMNRFISNKIGFLCIFIGLGLCIFPFSRYSANDKIVVLSNITIMDVKTHTFNWSPLIGFVMIGTGCIVLWQSYKKPKTF